MTTGELAHGSATYLGSLLADVNGVGRSEVVESPGCVVGQRGEVVPGSHVHELCCSLIAVPISDDEVTCMQPSILNRLSSSCWILVMCSSMRTNVITQGSVALTILVSEG